MPKKKPIPTVTVNGKIWTEPDIKTLIQTNEAAQLRALVLLNSKQTAHEKNLGHTAELNKVGFNKLDSALLQGFARQYKSRGFLSDRQMDILRKRLPKYSKQIFNHMLATNK